MQLQRQAMEQRLGSGNAVQNQAMAPASASGQGYLTRSRQASVRGRSPSINQHGWDYDILSSGLIAANGCLPLFQRKLQLSN